MERRTGNEESTDTKTSCYSLLYLSVLLLSTILVTTNIKNNCLVMYYIGLWVELEAWKFNEGMNVLYNVPISKKEKDKYYI